MSRTQSTGYLLIDHSSSPGLPADFSRRVGRNFVASGEGETFEADTYVCCHCNAMVLKAPGKTDAQRNTCRKCNKVTCHQAACQIDCVPIDKLFDTMLDRAAHGEVVTETLAELRRSILG